MRQYELMLVVNPAVEVTDKTAGELVNKVIGDQAKATAVSIIGKKSLAYVIKKQTQGTYVVATLEGAGIRVGELEKKVQMGTDVLRYLLTIKK